MNFYLPRVVESLLAEALANVPAIFIEGPKGVGKTATAKRFAKTVFELDNPVAREALAGNLGSLAKLPRPVLVDEWQFLPDVWNKVRRLVDDGAPKGSFILTGSVSKMDQNLHSGAGRILSIRMRPFSLQERFGNASRVSIAALLDQKKPFSKKLEGEVKATYEDYVGEIVRSGLPGIRGADAAHARNLLNDYARYAVTHDFAAQGVNVRSPNTLMRWLKSYAAAVATDAGYGAILDASTGGEADKPARNTTASYREALERLWLIDELPAWLDGGDWLSRLKLTPRHHLADPALVCALLGIGKNDLLMGRATSVFERKNKTFAGRLFESLVAQSMKVFAEACEASVSFLRTRNGDHEVDLIIQRGRRVLAFEVKIAPTVSDDDVKHLLWLREKLGADLVDAAVITTGPYCYRRQTDKIGVIPAAMLGP